MASDNWGERLSIAMKARGFSKALAFATELGVSESAVSRWKKGESITMEHAVQVCRTLNISLNWLLLGQLDEENAQRSKISQVILTDFEKLPAPICHAIEMLILEIIKLDQGLA